jgi:hypothetical protein
MTPLSHTHAGSTIPEALGTHIGILWSVFMPTWTMSFISIARSFFAGPFLFVELSLFIATALLAYLMSTVIYRRIFRRECVSSYAMSLFCWSWRKSESQVDFPCNGLQVRRITAKRIPAMMVNIEPNGNGTDKQSISNSMSSDISAVHSHYSIWPFRMVDMCSSPEPTIGIRIDANFIAHSLGKIYKTKH